MMTGAFFGASLSYRKEHDMATTDFWRVDGVTMPCPSSFEWGLQDVSLGESGRTDDALMWKNRVSQKRKIAISYNGITTDVCAKVLQAVNPEYIQVYYWDLMDNQYETRTFYVGDRTAPYKCFWVGNHRVERLSFDIIER